MNILVCTDDDRWYEEYRVLLEGEADRDSVDGIDGEGNLF